MTDSMIPIPPRPMLPVAGGGTFPVRRIYCIGRNYADHAREMGHDPDREPPFFFQKNPENADPSGRFPYPDMTDDVHHEVELAVALSGGGQVQPADALGLVCGYGVALDMTRRDRQAEMKKAGRPWEIAKAFARSAPIGPIHPVAEIGHLATGRIALSVDGTLRQEGDLAQMIWGVPEMIAYLSRAFDIGAGDLILTGTPAGVGPIQRGQMMLAEIACLPPLSVQVV